MADEMFTTKELAQKLKIRPRKVRELAIPYYKIGRERRYNPEDVEHFIAEAKRCPSLSDPTPPIITTSSKSPVIEYAAALRLRPVVKRKKSSGTRKSA